MKIPHYKTMRRSHVVAVILIILLATYGLLKLTSPEASGPKTTAERIAALKSSAEFQTTFGNLIRQEEKPACDAISREPAYAKRIFHYPGDVNALFDFYSRIWEVNGWKAAGRDERNLYYEKSFGDWRGGLRVLASGPYCSGDCHYQYSVYASVEDPLCS